MSIDGASSSSQTSGLLIQSTAARAFIATARQAPLIQVALGRDDARPARNVRFPSNYKAAGIALVFHLRLRNGNSMRARAGELGQRTKQRDAARCNSTQRNALTAKLDEPASIRLVDSLSMTRGKFTNRIDRHLLTGRLFKVGCARAR